MNRSKVNKTGFSEIFHLGGEEGEKWCFFIPLTPSFGILDFTYEISDQKTRYEPIER